MPNIGQYEALFLDDLEEIERALTKEIERLTANLETKDGRLDDSEASLQQALSRRRQVGSFLDVVDSDFTGRLEDALAAIGQETFDENNTFPNGFSPELANQFEKIVSPRIQELKHVFGDVSDDVRKSIAYGVSTGLSRDKLNARIAKEIGKGIATARTVTTTAIFAANRQANVAGADDSGIDYVYFYSGPIDQLTRPFCLKWIEDEAGNQAAYTREALKALARDPLQKGQPGQKLGDVAGYLGGYNCRHTLLPMMRIEAEEEEITIRDVEDVRRLM